MNYRHLTDADFLFYKRQLRNLESNIESFCLAQGFSINRDRYYHETLAVNLNPKNNSEFDGNICLNYLDIKGAVKFTLGLVKTHDIGRYRYWKKLTVIEESSLNYFEENIFKLLQSAFDTFNSIRIEDLTLRLERPERFDA